MERMRQIDCLDDVLEMLCVHADTFLDLQELIVKDANNAFGFENMGPFAKVTCRLRRASLKL